MHRCDFCSAMFQARPQVKHPKACSGCQHLRQRANEKAWHIQHRSGFDREYHRLQRDLRLKRLRELAERLCEWLKIGSRFLGRETEAEGIYDFFLPFLLHLGTRQINKFWQMSLIQ